MSSNTDKKLLKIIHKILLQNNYNNFTPRLDSTKIVKLEYDILYNYYDIIQFENKYSLLSEICKICSIKQLQSIISHFEKIDENNLRIKYSYNVSPLYVSMKYNMKIFSYLFNYYMHFDQSILKTFLDHPKFLEDLVGIFNKQLFKYILNYIIQNDCNIFCQTNNDDPNDLNKKINFDEHLKWLFYSPYGNRCDNKYNNKLLIIKVIINNFDKCRYMFNTHTLLHYIKRSSSIMEDIFNIILKSNYRNDILKDYKKKNFPLQITDLIKTYDIINQYCQITTIKGAI